MGIRAWQLKATVIHLLVVTSFAEIEQRICNQEGCHGPIELETNVYLNGEVIAYKKGTNVNRAYRSAESRIDNSEPTKYIEKARDLDGKRGQNRMTPERPKAQNEMSNTEISLNKREDPQEATNQFQSREDQSVSRQRNNEPRIGEDYTNFDKSQQRRQTEVQRRLFKRIVDSEEQRDCNSRGNRLEVSQRYEDSETQREVSICNDDHDQGELERRQGNRVNADKHEEGLESPRVFDEREVRKIESRSRDIHQERHETVSRRIVRNTVDRGERLDEEEPSRYEERKKSKEQGRIKDMRQERSETKRCIVDRTGNLRNTEGRSDRVRDEEEPRGYEELKGHEEERRISANRKERLEIRRRIESHQKSSRFDEPARRRETYLNADSRENRLDERQYTEHQTEDQSERFEELPGRHGYYIDTPNREAGKKEPNRIKNREERNDRQISFTRKERRGIIRGFEDREDRALTEGEARFENNRSIDNREARNNETKASETRHEANERIDGGQRTARYTEQREYNKIFENNVNQEERKEDEMIFANRQERRETRDRMDGRREIAHGTANRQQPLEKSKRIEERREREEGQERREIGDQGEASMGRKERFGEFRRGENHDQHNVVIRNSRNREKRRTVLGGLQQGTRDFNNRDDRLKATLRTVDREDNVRIGEIDRQVILSRDTNAESREFRGINEHQGIQDGSRRTNEYEGEQDVFRRNDEHVSDRKERRGSSIRIGESEERRNVKILGERRVSKHRVEDREDHVKYTERAELWSRIDNQAERQQVFERIENLDESKDVNKRVHEQRGTRIAPHHGENSREVSRYNGERNEYLETTRRIDDLRGVNMRRIDEFRDERKTERVSSRWQIPEDKESVDERQERFNTEGQIEEEREVKNDQQNKRRFDDRKELAKERGMDREDQSRITFAMVTRLQSNDEPTKNNEDLMERERTMYREERHDSKINSIIRDPESSEEVVLVHDATRRFDNIRERRDERESGLRTIRDADKRHEIRHIERSEDRREAPLRSNDHQVRRLVNSDVLETVSSWKTHSELSPMRPELKEKANIDTKRGYILLLQGTILGLAIIKALKGSEFDLKKGPCEHFSRSLHQIGF